VAAWQAARRIRQLECFQILLHLLLQRGYLIPLLSVGYNDACYTGPHARGPPRVPAMPRSTHAIQPGNRHTTRRRNIVVWVVAHRLEARVRRPQPMSRAREDHNFRLLVEGRCELQLSCRCAPVYAVSSCQRPFAVLRLERIALAGPVAELKLLRQLALGRP
jgi:hypothetical protein